MITKIYQNARYLARLDETFGEYSHKGRFFIAGALFFGPIYSNYGSILQALSAIFIGLNIAPKNLNMRIESLESESAYYLRMCSAAVGMTALSYGVYCLGWSLYDLSLSNEERLMQAKNTFLSCPKARELWESVQKKGAFNLSTSAVDHIATFDAISFADRDIRIHDKDPRKVVSILMGLGRLHSEVSQERCPYDMKETVGFLARAEQKLHDEMANIYKGCREGGFWKSDPNHLIRLFVFLRSLHNLPAYPGDLQGHQNWHINGPAFFWRRCGLEPGYINALKESSPSPKKLLLPLVKNSYLWSSWWSWLRGVVNT